MEDASRGIKVDPPAPGHCSTGVQEPDIQAAFTKLREAHGCVVPSKKVKAMVQGRDRRPELAYKLAVECRWRILHISESHFSPLQEHHSLSPEEQELQIQQGSCTSSVV